MSNEYTRHSIHSGLLNLFERRKSRHCWSECWAVLGSDSLRLFTNHESFLNASEEPKLIQLTADTFCESVHIKGKNCQFKICSGDTFMFKCESESVRQEWLAKLGMVLSGFCRNNCFHCNGKYAGISITSDNGSTDRSRQNSADKMYSQAGEIIQGTFNSECTNTQRNSTGCEDHITLKSPLKIYDTEENIFSSFNKTDKKARTQSETDAVTVNVNTVQEHLQSNTQVGQSMKSEKSPKNSFGYSIEADNADNITRSSLTLFDTEHKRFSTFSKRSSLKRERPVTMFANPGFVLEDQSFATDGPPIPKTISKVYDAPLNYDVPALSKNDPRRGSLKVLTGKNNWKKYEAVVEGNILILSDPESSSSEKNCARIELKPNIKFTHLPRRNNDYRFKMLTGTSEYFLKTANVMRRDSWIKALTEASSTVCQMGCPRCCTKANRNDPSFNENEASQSDTNAPGVDQWDENADEVFYVGMAKPDEGITFVNSQMDESENVLHSACEGTTTEPGHNEDQQLVPFHSGYLKTNAIGNNWEQYWATITGKQLVLHSSEENLNSLKTIELTQNVQCKTAKRSSYDFRFTLVLSAHECCEFKCATAHGRRQWMTALERAGWGVGQESNAGSKISEIVTKIRENQNKLEEIQHQQQVEKEREKQRQEMELQQQQQQQQQPQIRAENEDFYEVIPAENNLQQQISSPRQHVPQPTPPQKRQQQQNADMSQDIYDDVSANDTSQQSLPTAEISAVHRDADELELTAEDKNQNQSLRNTNDCKDNYKMMTRNNNQQKQQLPPPPQHLPPLTPPQRRQKKQQSQTIGNDLENVDNFPSGNIPQQSSLPPPPQQLPPLTPPQKRHQPQQQQDSDNGNDIYDDFVTAGNTQKQQLPPPPQQLPPPTPPQEREEQWQLTQEQSPSNAEDVGQDVYELIPGDNGKQQNQEELYEIIPAEKNGPQHQQPSPAPAEPQLQQQQQKQKNEQQNKEKKHKEKKNKRILPELQTKKQKKEKKKHKGNSDELEQKDHKQNEKDKSKQQKQKQQQAELEQNEDTMEEQNESSWNFEEHVQVLGEVNSTNSIVNEEAQLELKEEGSDMCAAENKSEITCPDEQTAVAESNLTQDVERFLTQVLGKLDNLPDDVNKERLELSKKLQKFLNLPDKSVGKKKPALPPPTEPVKKEVNEVDEGEYGDVASVQAQGEETYDDVVKDVPAGEETYDDVNAKGPTIDDQETYDDVVALGQTGGESKSESSPEPEEMYDDVNTSISAASTKQKSLSRLSNSSLDTKDVGEPKKPSDIKDKIFEGYLDKYKTKGLFTKKWQKRYCVLTPLALYYYDNPKDQRQKGQIILPSSGSTLRDGCESFPDVKDKKLCFELVNNDRSFLFKVGKESELDVWKQHIKAALQTDLSDEQSKLMRQKSFKISGHDEDEMEDGEELYECIDTMQQTGSASNTAEPDEELYELTDQFAPSKETSASSSEAPAVPSRDKTPPEKPSTAPPAHAEEEEEFEKMDDDNMEDYQLPDASAPKPGSQKASSGSPTLPTRPSSTHDAPNLPPRVPKSTPGSQKPPELPTRTTPSTAKKTPPELPTRTTPTLTKKSPSPPADEPESFPPPPPSLLEPEPEPEPEETAPPPVKTAPPPKTKPGEKFDYNRVYVALWNCNSDDEDDLEFSRGNYLYIREKIPNSDWWVASLMDIPDIRVGLVPRNYIMPAYDL